MPLVKISTEYLSTHRDFKTVEELEAYLEENNLDYVDSGTTRTSYNALCAIYDERSYIVLPVGQNDLTINFTYEG